MSGSGGSILCQQAYAQGKMLDHSGWQGRLPRGITPSDVDIVFDNSGALLYCEISSQYRDWTDIVFGQNVLYQNIIFKTKNLAILCRHDVDCDQQINTLMDVTSFHIRAFNFSKKEIIESPVIFGNERWQQFVGGWFDNAASIYQWVIDNPRDNTEWLAACD